MIDIKKYMYDTLKNTTNHTVVFRDIDGFLDSLPCIAISFNGWHTNFKGVRNESFQIDIFGKNIEETENLKNIVIQQLNRRFENGIRTTLTGTGPDMNEGKSGVFREILLFECVFLDSDY